MNTTALLENRKGTGGDRQAANRRCGRNNLKPSSSNNSLTKTKRMFHDGGLFAAPSCGLIVLLLLLIHACASSSSPFDASSSLGSNIIITPRQYYSQQQQRQHRRVQTNTGTIINGQAYADNDYDNAALGNPDSDVDAYFTGQLRTMTGLESCLFCPNDASSGLACLGLVNPDGNTGVSPEACLPCASGQTYWPCNLVDTCYCRTPTGEIILPDDLLNEDTNTATVGIGTAVNIAVAPTTAAPSKYPSVVVEEDVFEVVPLRFDVIGLPIDAALGDFKKELQTAMSKIILNLAKDIQGLKVTKVEEKVGGLSAALSNTNSNNLVDSVYYTVEVVKDPKKRFAPLIIQGLRDSYDEILQMIGSYSDVEFFTEGITIDICVMQNGKYTACASGNTPQSGGGSTTTSSSSSSSQRPLSESDLTFAKFDTNGDGRVSLGELKIGLEKELPPTTDNTRDDGISIKTVQQLVYDYDESGDGTLQQNEFVSVYTFSDRLDSYHAGLAGWAVALIVIFVLLFVCCIGYAVAVVCFGVANIFDYCCYSDDYGEDTTTKIRRDIFDDDERSRRSRQTIMPNVLLIDNGDNRGSDTGELALIDEEEMTVNTYSTRGTKSTYKSRSRMGRDPTVYYTGNTVGRDPTMYIPGREDATDPHSSVDDSSTYYTDDKDQSRMKVNREPTMYVDGLRGYDDDDYKQPRREPTMYVDGTEYKPQRGQPSMYSVDDSTIEEVHTDYRVAGGGGGGAGGKRSSSAPNHDDSYIIPEDASVSIKSLRSSRSMRKQSDKSYGAPRKTNSYYK